MLNQSGVNSWCLTAKAKSFLEFHAVISSKAPNLLNPPTTSVHITTNQLNRFYVMKTLVVNGLTL